MRAQDMDKNSTHISSEKEKSYFSFAPQQHQQEERVQAFESLPSSGFHQLKMREFSVKMNYAKNLSTETERNRDGMKCEQILQILDLLAK